MSSYTKFTKHSLAKLFMHFDCFKKKYFYFFGRQMHLMPQPWKGSRDASVFVFVMVNRP